jgi:anti-sigma-K factor RskA
MNDFSELENELRALRPARPSPVLFERIEEALVEDRKAPAHADADAEWSWRLFTKMPFRFGIGLVAAAAAVLLLLARINTDQTRNGDKEVAQVSAADETRAVLPAFSGGSGAD